MEPLNNKIQDLKLKKEHLMSMNFSSVTALEDIKPKNSYRNKILNRSISTKKFCVDIIDENFSTL